MTGQRLPEEEKQDIISSLRHEDPAERQGMLAVLWDDPSGDPELLPYIEALLVDRTPVIVSIPYAVGEVRWVAAHALSAERAAASISTPVSLARVPRPLSLEQLSALLDAKGIDTRGGMEGLLSGYQRLAELGALPVVDLELVGIPPRIIR